MMFLVYRPGDVPSRSQEQMVLHSSAFPYALTLRLLALVWSLAERWVAEWKVVRLVTAPDFLCELRAGYDATRAAQGDSYHALMERYQTRDVLVFDDLGAEKLTDWVEDSFSCSWITDIGSGCRCWLLARCIGAIPHAEAVPSAKR